MPHLRGGHKSPYPEHGLAVWLAVIKYEFAPADDTRNIAERDLSLALGPYVFEGGDFDAGPSWEYAPMNFSA